MNQPAKAGVRVSASNREVSKAETIVSASARKKTPVRPSRKASGMKTTTGVSVDPTSGAMMSPRPSRMACRRSPPLRMRAWMDSTTTMASSMTKPIAAAMPPRVMRLKLIPSRCMTTRVMSTATGMTVTAVSVVPQLRRKRKMMTTERIRPKTMDSQTPPTDERTRTDWS